MLSTFLFLLIASAWAAPDIKPERRRPSRDPTCVAIGNALSSASALFYPGSASYERDISHWASSSTQSSKCSVEPGTAQDVGAILQIVGAKRTPFAVKGGGHATNPGFSSTTGVQIAMYRFNEVTYDPTTQTAVIGAGLLWDDVYAALEPFGVMVVGGRVSGVGVAGFSLGGGYSWKTNQYGLTVDTIVAYELVLPNGVVTNVTPTSNPELFFGLKGGFNNFGIVTKFTLQTHPQGPVWGGVIYYAQSQFHAINAATANFCQNVTDPKASTIVAYNNYLFVPIVTQLVFYDAPEPPPGVFDEFLKIPALDTDLKTRTFVELIQSIPTNVTIAERQLFHSVSIQRMSLAVLDAVVNETKFWASSLLPPFRLFLSYDIEPFLPSALAPVGPNSTTFPTAYPPPGSRALQPINILFSWLFSASDGAMHTAARESARQLNNVAMADGQDLTGAVLYPNYALADTPLVDLYGENVGPLEKLKGAVDPGNVMGLAGGFKF